FVLLGIIGAIIGDGDNKNDNANATKSSTPAATASPEPTAVKSDAPSEDATPTTAPTTTAPKPTASKTPAPDATTNGGDINRWVAKMSSHGVTWQKTGVKESMAGLPPTLTWFGEAKGATFSAPSFVAHAIADTHRKVLSLSCTTAGYPKGSSADQVAIFTDCITAADLDGIDNAKVRNWIQTKLPAMLAKDGMQIEYLELGTATLSMDTAGNTANIGIEEQ
ncbi:hypothetical protein, partial [Lysinibacillus sp. NPDC056185]|uniref:hypothetical protein n=1 Tax=Lysinibacillus sp. NPDC056185 TaxID=3345739 RepID=UPI0039EE0AF6